MENLLSFEPISTVLAASPFLQYLLDLLLKSSLLFGATYLIATLFRRRISNNGAHLLWSNSMLCIGLLPLAMALLRSYPAVLLDSGPIAVLTISAGQTSAVEPVVPGSLSIIGFLYGLISLLLLSRLVLSAKALRRIDGEASECVDENILPLLTRLRESLQISRTVAVKFSERISSPMSFGLFKPVVILPAVATSWPESTQEDVLVHELSHIKRLDWATMLYCHLLTSLLWINPLVWFAKNRVNETAEQACDAAVLRHGKDGVNYAEELLRLARESLSYKQAPLLAQLMFDESSLSLRIRNILDGGLIGKASKAFVAALILGASLVLGACSGINLFGAGATDQELRLINEAVPQYPTRAAQRGIAGWALVGFDVSETGRLVSGSAHVIDSEPRAIFDRSALRAAERFEFAPRVRNGEAIRVNGVSYVFRYELEDDGNQAEAVRTAPQANNPTDWD